MSKSDRQIVLDTETTGLDPKHGHRVIELGCVELINRRYTGNNFHYYFNPDRMIDEGAMAVHGISNESLIDKPRFPEILPEFIDYIKDAELIIHNAKFDVGFLNHEIQLAKLKFKPIAKYCKVFDTLSLARQLHPGQRNNLDALCKRYKVDNSTRDLHGALLDAEILSNVYLAMTAGQKTLFGSELNDNSKIMQEVEIDIKNTSGKKIPVVKASDAELKAHQQYLAEIDKKSDAGVVWNK